LKACDDTGFVVMERDEERVLNPRGRRSVDITLENVSSVIALEHVRSPDSLTCLRRQWDYIQKPRTRLPWMEYKDRPVDCLPGIIYGWHENGIPNEYITNPSKTRGINLLPSPNDLSSLFLL
jgi:hypothetical protein